MNKTRQQYLLRWLRSQSAQGKGWLRLSMLLGMLSAVLVVGQAWLLATLLQALIVTGQPRDTLISPFMLLLVCFFLRALLAWGREKVGFEYGKAIRQRLRRTILDRLHQLGPACIQGKPAGSWATLLLEQIEDMQDYYARYQPQMLLAVFIPLTILIALFPVNWAAALILLATAPLIPLFMALVGLGAAEANRRNFSALARLSGHFLDRLRGLETLRLFNRATAETAQIREASADFRRRTMDVLRLAFLSSAVLEFFASLSIAVVAVYFGFSYLGELNFGHYGTGITLFAGFLALILAPEFFQPLRDMGTFYHAKAQAVGGADALETFLSNADTLPARQGKTLIDPSPGIALEARNVVITSISGKVLAGPLNFSLAAGQRVAVIGQSGAGKTSLLGLILGHLPYQGSLLINGVELRDIEPGFWQQQLAWVGQNPHLPARTLRENIVMDGSDHSDRLRQVTALAGVDEFLPHLPAGLESETGEHARHLSVGQAQRIAVARALYKPCRLMLLDEPGASLDSHSEQQVNQALHDASFNQTTLLVTHQLEQLDRWDEIWLMREGKIIQRGTHGQLVQYPGAFTELASHRQERAQ
ncbi:cysteine/glutathione ABC transporter permease/ATP-binding protein CydD [Erwinia sp. HDF1-3R]|uniref:heme ABC transporter permease/ATP-binding protein CydD n=1 Tax=Erwinia sp. HDF1-3R TaxID=3141543 RepID=UPI0031F5AB65